LVLLVALVGAYIWQSNMSHSPDFTVSNERILTDLNGRTAPLGVGQVWPFDTTQNLTVKVIGKKTTPEFTFVVVQMNATAKLPKDQKDSKAPTKVNLNGLAKLTYEFIGNEWYLMAVDNVSLSANAQ